MFIDMERRDKPMLFVTPSHGKATVKAFAAFLKTHQGHPDRILEVASGMSGAFLSALPKYLPNAQITVDWFHIVKTFSDALNEVRKAEAWIKPLPKHLHWAVLQRGEANRLTHNQLEAHAERIVRRWTSTYTNARLEGLNGLFQAARGSAERLAFPIFRTVMLRR